MSYWSSDCCSSDLLLASPVPVVSFTLGFPAPGVIKALRAAGSLVVLTVTSEAEALLAVDAGADMLVVQSSAAGGQSGTLTPLQVPAETPKIGRPSCRARVCMSV